MNASTHDLDMVRVLIVDDDRVIRELLRRMLDQGGLHSTMSADSGDTAWKTLQSGGDIPDLVITDLHMKGMDGLELCRKMRRAVGPLSHVPVLILTADHIPLVHEVAEQIGATEVLTKPISTNGLLEAIGRALGYRVAAVATDQAAPTHH